MNQDNPGSLLIGRARVFEAVDLRTPSSRPVDDDTESERYAAAFGMVRARFETSIASTHNRFLASGIRFHAAILTDPDLSEDIRRRIAVDHQTADRAVEDAYARAISAVEKTGGYIGARAEDFREVRDHLLEKLFGSWNATTKMTFAEPTVIVCERFTLDVLTRFEPDRVVAVLAASGGVNSHAAIALASENIPLVIDPAFHAAVHDGEIIAVRPPRDLAAAGIARAAVMLCDDVTIEVAPLVNTIAEMRRPGFADFAGIGLFRTEFAILGAGRFPGVDEQVENYRLIAAAMPSKPVCFRLYDIAPDKPVIRRETNVFGARYLVHHPSVLDDQLTALLILSAERPVDILVPMVESASDWQFIVAHASLCADRVRELAGSAVLRYRIGAMIETRRAILAMSGFSGASFVSVGSNDLAADLGGRLRTESGYDPRVFHEPLFEKALDEIVVAAHRLGASVSLCGAAADESDAIRLAVRSGIRRFIPSVAAAYAVYPSLGER